MLSQAVDEAAGQGGGHLKELIRVEERSHCGVQTGKSPEQDINEHVCCPGPLQGAKDTRDLQNGPGGLPPDHQTKRLL